MPDPVISVRNLNHAFGTAGLRRQILFDVSTEIMPGEIVLMMGPSGSGKTTLLTLIGALRSVQEGTLRTLGVELAGASPAAIGQLRHRIGFVFQAHNLLRALTARQNVQAALALDPSVPVSDARAQAVEMLEAVGLGEHVDKLPHLLSGGQRQRVAIARALVRKPMLVLADEPTAALDSTSGREVVDLLHNLAKRQGAAILLVTHDNRILDIADRILALEDGRLASSATGLMVNAGRLLSSFTSLHRKGELRQRVASLNEKQLLEVADGITAECDALLQSLDAARDQVPEAVLDDVLEALTMRLASELEADRASLFLIDRGQRLLRSRIAQGSGSASLRIDVPLDRGIVGRVAARGELANVADVQKDPDFFPDVDRQTGYETKTILCAPLRNRRQAVVGVIELLNKKGGGAFTKRDEELCAELIEPLGVVLEGCQRLAAR